MTFSTGVTGRPRERHLSGIAQPARIIGPSEITSSAVVIDVVLGSTILTFYEFRLSETKDGPAVVGTNDPTTKKYSGVRQLNNSDLDALFWTFTFVPTNYTGLWARFTHWNDPLQKHELAVYAPINIPG